MGIFGGLDVFAFSLSPSHPCHLRSRVRAEQRDGESELIFSRARHSTQTIARQWSCRLSPPPFFFSHRARRSSYSPHTPLSSPLALVPFAQCAEDERLPRAQPSSPCSPPVSPCEQEPARANALRRSARGHSVH
ncbi:hypothetical protein RRG08_043535 [Elysia crispata]|uniref:Uncharacterized protein n=1 Tax=Elysia crispata TaxID=231223 RepID=A0AAE1CXW6_9GAST|nr:hypothetical protein RRG08_043535 [Elysia crispata]